jgi:PTH1 family peptidyl-tRNA hydrolase
MIRLIVGLGNPGTEYERTRHNVGFWWVDGAARKLGATLKSDRAYHGLTARVNRADGPLFLLEPQTYMNLSGLSRFFKIAPQDVLVVHDEIDLPPGQMKLKLGGGVAGHNGLKDLKDQLGSADFWRLRIGVGHPGNRDEVADWVLRKPSPEQRELIEGCVERSLGVLELLIDGPMERAMMKIHAKPKAAPAAAATGPAPAAPAK